VHLPSCCAPFIYRWLRHCFLLRLLDASISLSAPAQWVALAARVPSLPLACATPPWDPRWACGFNYLSNNKALIAPSSTPLDSIAVCMLTLVEIKSHFTIARFVTVDSIAACMSLNYFESYLLTSCSDKINPIVASMSLRGIPWLNQPSEQKAVFPNRPSDRTVRICAIRTPIYEEIAWKCTAIYRVC
jgi:hypothetical protein